MNQENQKETLILVDGSNYAFRAFAALPNLRINVSDQTSQATGAIYGIINMLQSLREKYPANYGVCVFDCATKTFREEMFKDYKGHRLSMPEDLASQLPLIHEIVEFLGWKIAIVPGVEADDVIATLAKKAELENFNVVISSGDKDFAQLVNKNIILFDAMRNKVSDINGVINEFKVAPELIIDYLSLVGDSSDNVPGVPSIGKINAAKLLNEYKSLDNLIKNAENIKGIRGKNLIESINNGQLKLSKQLITLKVDVENLPDIKSTKFNNKDIKNLLVFYEKYGFKTHLNNLKNEEIKENKNNLETFNKQLNITEIKNENELKKCLEKIKKCELISIKLIQTKTKKKDIFNINIEGIIFAIKNIKKENKDENNIFYIPLNKDENQDLYSDKLENKYLNKNFVFSYFKDYLEDENYIKIAYNLKNYFHIFDNFNIKINGFNYDVLLQSYILESYLSNDFDKIIYRHLNENLDSLNSLDLINYNCQQASLTLDLHNILYSKMKNTNLQNIYELELELSKVLFQIERFGVLIDKEELLNQGQDLSNRIKELENEIYILSGEEFNLNSPKQLAYILFEKLNIKTIKKTKTGSQSTNEEVLEKLSNNYPIAFKILEYRELTKLKNTYIDKLPKTINFKTNRIHTNYTQTVTNTGRLSSLEPNLQNIPIKTNLGRNIRKSFIADKNKILASCDYSQIELRIMAQISEDENLIKAFNQGLDIHKSTASEIFNIELNQVNSQQRNYAKSINFGLIYGMGNFGLSKALNISNNEAENYIKKYFEKYQKIKEYMNKTIELAQKNGFVETLFGRKIYLSEINGANGIRRKASERAAINAPIQGTAADLIKKSMIKIQKILNKENQEIKLIMQVHDELIFELPNKENQKEYLIKLVNKIMINPFEIDLKIPLLVDIGFGNNWNEAH